MSLRRIQVRASIERRYVFKWGLLQDPGCESMCLRLKRSGKCDKILISLISTVTTITINLTAPLFDSGSIDVPHSTTHLVAMSSNMCEFSEGLMPHPVCTAEYIKKSRWPVVHPSAVKSSCLIVFFKKH
jgi:hypothetical protein